MGYGNEEEFLTPQQREELLQSLLGKTVEVVIDRPIGYVHHTKGVTLHYTINYGYLPGVMGGDGEEQDAYVLGVTKPLERFTGTVIGAIRRRDDNEDKLVVAPQGMLLHQGQIAEATYFVEKYFDSTVACLLRKSCGVIPYRWQNGCVEFLLLFQRFSQSWSFPKGHMEMGETEQQTALRETKEETGLEPVLQPEFRKQIEYQVGPKLRKQLVLFLGAVSGEPGIDGPEITDFRWVTASTAEGMLFPEQKALLEEAEIYLKKTGEAK